MILNTYLVSLCGALKEFLILAIQRESSYEHLKIHGWIFLPDTKELEYSELHSHIPSSADYFWLRTIAL